MLFDTATNRIDRLARAHHTGTLEADLQKIGRYKLILIDEVGAIPFDTDAADLFFQLVASRDETGSILVADNLPSGRWGEVFGDEVVAAAMIYRLVHHTEASPWPGLPPHPSLPRAPCQRPRRVDQDKPVGVSIRLFAVPVGDYVISPPAARSMRSR